MMILSTRLPLLGMIMLLAMTSTGCQCDCADPALPHVAFRFQVQDLGQNPIRIGTPPANDSSSGLWIDPRMGAYFTYEFATATANEGAAQLNVLPIQEWRNVTPPMPRDSFRLDFYHRNALGTLRDYTLFMAIGARITDEGEESDCCPPEPELVMDVFRIEQTLDLHWSDNSRFTAGGAIPLDHKGYYSEIWF